LSGHQHDLPDFITGTGQRLIALARRIDCGRRKQIGSGIGMMTAEGL